MKRIITTIILAAAVMVQASAQTIYDGLVFSENNYVGTARSLAMGNAFTALGGDLGSITLNPAGSAVSSYSQVTITPGFNTAVSTTTGIGGFGTGMTSSKSQFTLPNVGFVLNYDTHKGYGLKSWSVGLVANSTNYFADKTLAEGDHYGTSYAGWLASCTDGNYSDLSSADAYYSGAAWDAVVGVQSGITSAINGTGNTYVGATEKFKANEDGSYDFFVGGPLTQDYGRLMKGGKTDLVLNLGFNINDWIFIGGNLGFSNIKYDYQWFIRETAVDPSDFEIEFTNEDATTTLTYFNTLRYQYWYKATGTSIYGKLGIILTPGDWLRLGAAIESTGFTAMKEKYGVTGLTEFADSKYNSSSTSPDGEYSYIFKSPMRFSFGAAANIGSRAVVSLDYELANYKSMKFKSTDNDLEDSFDNGVNLDIKDCMTAQHNVRLGAEFKPASFLSLRAGYNFIDSPVRKYWVDGELAPVADQFKHSVSCGLGFSSSKSFFADLGFRSLFYGKESIRPYDDYAGIPSPSILSSKVLLSGVLTIGFRF